MLRFEREKVWRCTTVRTGHNVEGKEREKVNTAGWIGYNHTINKATATGARHNNSNNREEEERMYCIANTLRYKREGERERVHLYNRVNNTVNKDQ